MFILALLDFFIQTAFFILYVVIYNQSEAGMTAAKLIPYASDILTFSNAYLLIILNKRIRARVLSFTRCSDSATVKASTLNNRSSAVVVSVFSTPKPSR
ncbi:hypothetical protein Y032_0425g1230 [Ancylostoma ceylanicum]|nr:hypothetical protein Y032_0425g1230 [Ancylostoma ceylanicum]